MGHEIRLDHITNLRSNPSQPVMCGQLTNWWASVMRSSGPFVIDGQGEVHSGVLHNGLESLAGLVHSLDQLHLRIAAQLGITTKPAEVVL